MRVSALNRENVSRDLNGKFVLACDFKGRFVKKFYIYRSESAEVVGNYFQKSYF